MTLAAVGEQLFVGEVLIEIVACTDLVLLRRLRKCLFEHGVLPVRGRNENAALYVRSDLVLEPNLLSTRGSNAMSMTALGRTGRFGNQPFRI